MTYKIVRMPKTDEKLQEVLERIAAFIDGMYTEHDAKWHGPMRFQLPHWLYLWDSGTGFFVEKTNSEGKTVALAMCTKFNDMWSGRARVDIVKFSLLAGETGEDGAEVEELAEYLKGVNTILQFEELYYSRGVDNGGEYKELIWRTQ